MVGFHPQEPFCVCKFLGIKIIIFVSGALTFYEFWCFDNRCCIISFGKSFLAKRQKNLTMLSFYDGFCSNKLVLKRQEFFLDADYGSFF